ncbi:hypothetical protein A2V56_02465 [Candidatus Woesebacteria bacterium RBG_19FT_COMBO_42_9]|uniref:Uncharacterized protein n=1 Tax=Candidatus Woesebacteria bacterium RBG_16_42_24 TaxID=1802485 RepID=A0A1F7XL32_9BACT|nr:MAG: hypothetical protein A2V97_03285 [Candidatus Woesebacteria bacterium RBG_16_42_24]OGM16983.1 MAG: hypothetical protein A2V56_02465 [Candidatus Woesebacteria bacterium RBG_19FT_COMBO_42_9]OGM68440.1 MAG: hypothetical protein A2985_01420 [Candidatus Woesebacteria bacterium RIFCSPLOWO2_01_FULL_43_11]
MEYCKHRLTLEEVGKYVLLGEELTGTDLIKKQGGCFFAARDFSVNPPYCPYPDKSHHKCPIAQEYGLEESSIK